MADKQNNATTELTIELGTKYQVKKIEIEKTAAAGIKVIQRIEPVDKLRYTVTDSLLTKGINVYRVKITLNDGKIIYSNKEIVYNISKDDFIVFPNPLKLNQGLNILSEDTENTLFQLLSIDGRLLIEKNSTIL